MPRFDWYFSYPSLCTSFSPEFESCAHAYGMLVSLTARLGELAVQHVERGLELVREQGSDCWWPAWLSSWYSRMDNDHARPPMPPPAGAALARRPGHASPLVGTPGPPNLNDTSTGAATGLVAGHQAPAPRLPTQPRSLTFHPAQPACVSCQALQTLPVPNQDGLAAEPANRSGIQLGAGGREADPAGRRQGERSGPQRRVRGSVSSPVADLQPLHDEEVRLLWQAQEAHRGPPRHARLGHCSLLLQPWEHRLACS